MGSPYNKQPVKYPWVTVGYTVCRSVAKPNRTCVTPVTGKPPVPVLYNMIPAVI